MAPHTATFPDTTAHRAIAERLSETWRQTSPEDEIAWLLQQAERLARDNVASFQGGPFGALVVDPAARQVLGAAANHVTLWNDPTAHAEILALRAATEAGHDPAGALLLSSCECCPMCLAAAFQSGLRRIHYHATRRDAAAAGFADAAQYALIAEPMAAQATHLHPGDARYGEAAAQLAGDAACLLVPGPGGWHRLGADKGGSAADPTATACIRALRQACQAWGAPRLPPGSRLLSRRAPHPLSLLAADWANLGRGADLDDPAKDAGAILYLDTTSEAASGLEAAAMWQALRAPESAGMALRHHPLPAREAFAAWMADRDKLQRY